MVRLKLPSGLIATTAFRHVTVPAQLTGTIILRPADGSPDQVHEVYDPERSSTTVAMSFSLPGTEREFPVVSSTVVLKVGEPFCYYKARYYVLKRLFKHIHADFQEIPLTGDDCFILLRYFALKMFIDDKPTRYSVRNALNELRVWIPKEEFKRTLDDIESLLPQDPNPASFKDDMSDVLGAAIMADIEAADAAAVATEIDEALASEGLVAETVVVEGKDVG